MTNTSQKTTSIKEKDLVKKWYFVDATDQILGRLSTKLATVLRGKHKPQFTPHIDCGDFLVVVNAEKVKLTGNKWNDKIYYNHSRHVGGLKSKTAKQILVKHPSRLIMTAVQGMLPKNSLNRRILKKLKVYAGDKHPHQAQNPVELKV